MKSVRVVCAHDCPDMCSLIAHVEDGKVVRVQGDPDHPYTAGFACGKVNRDADLVNSPDASPRRSGAAAPRAPASSSRSAGTRRSTRSPPGGSRSSPESGPLALLGYAYSAHQGLMNRGLVNGLFHALGTSRLQAGTVCDTCCETAWDMTLGPVGGADPEIGRAFRPGDLVGRRPRRHQRAFLGAGRGAEEAARRADRGDRSAPHAQRQGGRFLPADPHRHRCRPGARRHAHPGARQARRPRLHRQAHAGLRQGRARDPAEVHAGADGRDHRPRRRRHREAGGDVRQGQGRADPPRRRHDPPHPWRPGAAHRGAAARRQRPLRREGRRRVPADGGVVRPQLRRRPQAVGPGERAHGQSSAAGRRAPEHEGPADPRALRLGQQSGGDLPRGPQGAERPRARGPVHRGARSLHDRHGAVTPTSCCRRRAISRPTISTAPTAPTGCSGASRPPSRTARRAPTSTWHRRSPGAWASPTQFSALSPQDAAQRTVQGRDRPRRRGRPGKLFAGEPIHIAHDWDGQPFATPSGKLEFYSEQLARLGLSPLPDWDEDPDRSRRRRQMAAAPADRARLLPGAHRFLGRRLPARARGQAVLHPASRGRRQARPRGRRRRSACSTTAARSA